LSKRALAENDRLVVFGNVEVVTGNIKYPATNDEANECSWRGGAKLDST
jgi:hypothetical protein